MQLTLTTEMETIVKERLASGLYKTPSEVVREALWLMEERDKIAEARRHEVLKEVEAGVDQLERGEYVMTTAEEIIDEVEKSLGQLSRKR